MFNTCIIGIDHYSSKRSVSITGLYSSIIILLVSVRNSISVIIYTDSIIIHVNECCEFASLYITVVSVINIIPIIGL